MPGILRDNLNTVDDARAAATVMANSSNWGRTGAFGRAITEVRRLVADKTGGLPTRSRGNAVRECCMWTGSNPNTCPLPRCGIGTQYFISGPTTFSIDPHCPAYAPANGELVAAHFPPPGDGVRFDFTLARHEIFHLALRTNEIAWSLVYPETLAAAQTGARLLPLRGDCFHAVQEVATGFQAQSLKSG